MLKDGKLYRTTAAIAVGDSLVVGTNIAQTTIGTEMALGRDAYSKLKTSAQYIRYEAYPTSDNNKVLMQASFEGSTAAGMQLQAVKYDANNNTLGRIGIRTADNYNQFISVKSGGTAKNIVIPDTGDMRYLFTFVNFTNNAAVTVQTGSNIAITMTTTSNVSSMVPVAIKRTYAGSWGCSFARINIGDNNTTIDAVLTNCANYDIDVAKGKAYITMLYVPTAFCYNGTL